jgi:hypothetical protein
MSTASKSGVVLTLYLRAIKPGDKIIVLAEACVDRAELKEKNL